MACPSAERLVDLVDGRLAETDQVILEAHIDSCETCRIAAGAIMREPTREWRLGRYKIIDVLGAGGMGIVYRAWDPALSRDVAVKVVKSGDEGLRTRLASEARSLARLNHPNVCQVYDVGTDAGEVWIAMELVRGPHLRGWLAARPPRAEILGLLDQAGRGIAAAHAAGLVHRDIKPENILVDQHSRAVVSDFGLARITEDRATRTSILAGTPAYMAPEQLDGSPADERSDQYALAVTIHEALLGTRPRPRNAASDTLPPALRAALDRALADDPQARFSSISALLDAVAAAGHRRRSRLPLVLAAAAVIAVVAGGVVIAGRAGSEDTTTSRATSSATNAPMTGSSVATNAPMTGSSGATRGATNVPMTGSSGASGAGASGVATSGAVASGHAASGAGNTHTVAPKIAAQIPRGAAGLPAIPTAPVQPTTPVPPTASMPAAAAAVQAAVSGNHIAAAVARQQAGDGNGCLAELAKVDPNDPWLQTESGKSINSTRANCMMLAGRCVEGRAAMREAEQLMAHGQLDEREVDRRVDSWVMINCRTGDLTDRDRLLHALYVLQDYIHKASVAECRAAYADAVRLAPANDAVDASDILHDCVDRVRKSAPACFARAGDCATAWAIAKDVDAKLPRFLNMPPAQAARITFSQAVDQKCADHDQGALTDEEMVYRVDDELREVRRIGTPKPAYCTQRIDAVSAALAKLTDRDALEHQRNFAKLGAACLALAGDCDTAWHVYGKLSTETDPMRLRQRYRSDVQACRFAAPGKLGQAEQVAWAIGVLEDGWITRTSAKACQQAYDVLVVNAGEVKGDVAQHAARCFAKVDDCATAWTAFQDAQRFSRGTLAPDELRRRFTRDTRCPEP